MDDDLLRAMVARAATGDDLAFARLVATHHDDMSRVAFAMCGDGALAQEAVQSAWSRAWTKLDTVRDPTRIRPWLMSIAANEAKQLARRRSRVRLREITIEDALEPDGARAPGPGSSSLRSSTGSNVRSPTWADPGDRAAELD